MQDYSQSKQRKFKRTKYGKKKVRSSNVRYRDGLPIVPEGNYFRLKSIIDLTADTSAGSGTNQRSVQTSFSDNPSGSADWASLATLYDSYRVTHMKIEFFPLEPNEMMRQGALSSSPTGLYPPLAVAYDVDSAAFPTLVNSSQYETVLQYGNSKGFQSNRPWKYQCKCTKPYAGTSAGTTAIIRDGMVDMATAAAFSSIIVGSQFVPQLFVSAGATDWIIGKVIQTWYVYCKNRR